MTTDTDNPDNLLAQRRELMDKIEEQIDERGRIIERIQSAPDTPIDRLREQAEALAGALEAIERETEHVNTRRGSRNGRIREAADAALRAYREATP